LQYGIGFSIVLGSFADWATKATVSRYGDWNKAIEQ
jgi:hypothetical protein